MMVGSKGILPGRMLLITALLRNFRNQLTPEITKKPGFSALVYAAALLRHKPARKGLEKSLYLSYEKMQLRHGAVSFDRKLCYNCWEGDVMKIKMKQDLSCSEIEVAIKYPQKSRQVNRIIELLQSVDMQIKCDNEHTERMINVSDIYYIESVDKKTFVYLEKSVYHTDFRLYQLKDKLQEHGFVQISRSCILNINALESIRPLLNSRMEAILRNGEKVYVNRNYLNEIKTALRGDKEI